MELIERPNIAVIERLKGLTLAQYTHLYEVSNYKKLTDKDNKPRSDYSYLKSYVKSVIESDGKCKVNYGFVENKSFGRLQSKNNSIQRIFNPIRGLLFDGITYDLDMSNAHPNILVNLCNKHNIKCDKIVDYIENREKRLGELVSEYNITRADAKSLFLQCINKEDITTKIRSKTIKNKFFIEFDKQSTEIINSMYELYKKEYEHFVTDKSYNKKGSILNLLLCKVENEYLQKAIKCLTSHKIEVCALMFDGCMIYKGDYEIESIIKELNKIFKDKKITWTVKDHSTVLKKPFDELDIKFVDEKYANDMVELTHYILDNKLKNRIYKCNSDVFYISDKKIISDSKEIKTELVNMITDQDYFIVNIVIDAKGEEVDKTKKVSKIKSDVDDLISFILAKAPRNDRFVKDVWEYTRFKLFFKNGYYDFIKKEFIEGNQNMTFIKIDRDYNPIRNKTAYDLIMKRLLCPVFSISDINVDKDRYELMKYFLHRVSRIMASHIEDKAWVSFEGNRNCGKGALTDLLQHCFGDYVGITNIENFIPKTFNSDAAKGLSWLVDFQFKRLIITQEASSIDKKSSEKTNMSGNAIKKFCSGGDWIQARKNHQDESSFRIQCSLFVCTNDMPDISPADAKEFCDEFHLKSVFVKPGDKSFKLKTIQHYEIDEMFKSNFLSRSDIQEEFVNILFDAYSNKCEYPEAIKAENIENDVDNNDTKKLLSYFIIGDTNDFVSNTELENLIKYTTIPFTMKKSKMILKAMGCIEGRSHDRTKRGLLGLHIRDEDKEPEQVHINEEQQTPTPAAPAAPASTDVDSDIEIIKVPDNWIDKNITVFEEKSFNNNKRIDFDKVKKVKKNDKVDKVEKVEKDDKDDYAVFKTKKIPISALKINFD